MEHNRFYWKKFFLFIYSSTSLIRSISLSFFFSYHILMRLLTLIVVTSKALYLHFRFRIVATEFFEHLIIWILKVSIEIDSQLFRLLKVKKIDRKKWWKFKIVACETHKMKYDVRLFHLNLYKQFTNDVWYPNTIHVKKHGFKY